ncbi:MAG: crossover junction endodeoxyribonuclease RuvC [Bacteroidota bacterium]|nr:crossover junction endodeoxyribonuclease RuvC [Bacteroidota bacterium]MDP4211323.1 crossover junction endodeoxyribonuclease RuvC [Bacteroidota bacterium]MDP4249988.1 crossover junction endodeoxyribonuclease RuvC [Bacteroidota bacterium]
MQKNSKIILGIDPGTLMMGYGLILAEGQQMRLIEMNTLHVPARLDAYQRLELIYFTVQQLIFKFRPTDFAIEAPFFGKNVQSMLKLGRAQGVAIAAAMQSCIPVTEYAPRKIKQSITGNGNAGKEQVWKMLQQILQIRQEIDHLDASDALAVAICHHFQAQHPVSKEKKLNGWGDFIAKNPGRAR